MQDRHTSTRDTNCLRATFAPLEIIHDEPCPSNEVTRQAMRDLVPLLILNGSVLRPASGDVLPSIYSRIYKTCKERTPRRQRRLQIEVIYLATARIYGALFANYMLMAWSLNYRSCHQWKPLPWLNTMRTARDGAFDRFFPNSHIYRTPGLTCRQCDMLRTDLHNRLLEHVKRYALNYTW